MYSILLVDDERFALEGLKLMIGRCALSISDIYTATSKKQAQQIIQSEQVNIIISDIEMPNGNGIELLQWVNQNHPQIRSIFLTCHPDFEYAKLAIQLGVVDYLLKPATSDELFRCISQAIEKLDGAKAFNSANRYWEFMVRNQSLVLESFIRKIIFRSVGSDAKTVKEEAELLHISIDEKNVFCPILVRLNHSEQSTDRLSKEKMNLRIRSCLNTIDIRDFPIGQSVSLDAERFVFIVEESSNERWNDDSQQALTGHLSAFVDKCKRSYDCKITCYVGRYVPFDEMADAVTALEAYEQKISINSGVFLTDSQRENTNFGLQTEEIEQWKLLMSTGDSRAYDTIHKWLIRFICRSDLEHVQLLNFQHDFMLIAHHALSENGFKASALLANETLRPLYDHACDSPDDMKNWIEKAISFVMETIGEAKKKRTLVDKVGAYIQANLAEALTRPQIASAFFVSPGYLSHVFSQKTGCSLSAYINDARMENAMRRLANTNDAIYLVASSVGFDNSAYFTKCFREHTGMTPKEYRQVNQSDRRKE